ncbi:PREDICTED: WEB family protein At1g75720-like [Ipomoea nil]|uniref:WEB family protein At1g75720-like n=1 Tax=Ipomoea nil TaxID=35883 RepID=UPI0009018859|nr:PREDICTED: WEB family protein At1g75720-like [Ipomoea nil]
MEGAVEGVVVRGRVQIDTRKPFRSVKEAVLMFGEKILAPEIYAKQINTTQVHSKTSGELGEKQTTTTRFGGVKAAIELEETKQELGKAKEEGTLMAQCLQSLKEELEQTKREIQQLKAAKEQRGAEIEELKFIEKAPPKPEGYDEEEEDQLFERKKSVKFANPPALTRVINLTKDNNNNNTDSPSLQAKKKLKRRPLIPLIGALFTKKKGSQ